MNLPSYMVVVVCPSCDSYDVSKKSYGVYECGECYTSFDSEHIVLKEIDPDVEFGELSDTTVMFTEEEQKDFTEKVIKEVYGEKIIEATKESTVFKTSYDECPKCSGMMQNSSVAPNEYVCVLCDSVKYKDIKAFEVKKEKE